jgi:opacity protein-like surface antigen
MIGGSRSILALSLLGVALASCSARAQMLDSNPSMGAGASRFLVQDKVDANIAYAQGHGMPLQLGTSFSPLRVEAGYGYSIFPSDSTRNLSVDPDIGMRRGIAKVYLSFTRPSLFTPYLGAGAAPTGDDTAGINGATVETENDTPLTAYGEVGVAFNVLPFVSISPAYRLIWIDGGEADLADTAAHLINLHARLAF